MTIKFLGHATFLITSSDEVRIITDPYEPGGFGGQIAYAPIADAADIVTVSHDHADHNYVRGVPGNPVVVTAPGQVRGINFEVVESYHDEARGSKRGGNRIFCFTVDGMRVCHLGDLGAPLTADQVSALGKVDVLLLPVGGFFTIDAAQATALAAQLNAPVVIPMHFKIPKVGFPIAPVEDFLTAKGNVDAVGGSELSLSPEDLGPGQRLVVLEPAN